MLLSKLLNRVNVIQVIGKPELVEIEHVSTDSRDVKVNSIFIAISGYKYDGHKFIQQAISNGASAIVVEKNDPQIDQFLSRNNIIKILVQSSRKTLAKISNELYERPSSKLNLIGITGTKGKTTTSFYIKSILEHAGNKTGLIGTNKNMIGDEETPTKLTTPESPVINSLLKKMVDSGCSNCVMEVSSHSIELSRIDDLDYNVGVFTNITSDHLDFHETFENYLSAKKIFFNELNPEAYLIYNKDDENYQAIIKDSKAKKISYSLVSKADLMIKNVSYNLNGTSFDLLYDNNEFSVKTRLIGLFNAYNSVAAIGAAIYSGVNIEDAIEGVYLTAQVPGRFEVIGDTLKKVIVDYSHTADSLKQALEAIKYINTEGRKVITVFGCGGDRDKTKRPLMGKIAEELSDTTIVTSDNPRTEDPFEIIKDIEKGMIGKNYQVIEDREEAIKTAILNSDDNAVILIAGKGHENYQEINGVRNYFSDREIAEKYL